MLFVYLLKILAVALLMTEKGGERGRRGASLRPVTEPGRGKASRSGRPPQPDAKGTGLEGAGSVFLKESFKTKPAPKSETSAPESKAKARLSPRLR